LEFKHPSPYPIPKVSSPNEKYSKLLLYDYTGLNGELAAILTYTYQSLNLKLPNDLRNAIIKVSEVEMIHLELLGKTISMLGTDPKFRTISILDNSKHFYNTENVNYSYTVCDVIKNNIKAEKTAIKYYKEHRDMINDPYIKDLLTRLILDEEIHVSIFEFFYEKYCKKGGNPINNLANNIFNDSTKPFLDPNNGHCNIIDSSISNQSVNEFNDSCWNSDILTPQITFCDNKKHKLNKCENKHRRKHRRKSCHKKHDH